MKKRRSLIRTSRTINRVTQRTLSQMLSLASTLPAHRHPTLAAWMRSHRILRPIVLTLTLALPSDIPLQRLEEAQNDDEELALILSQPDFELKLQRLEWLARDTRPIFIYCEVTDETVRPYIPKSLRNEVIALCHNPAHPGPKSTNKLLRRKYVWFTMSKDIYSFVKNCIPCQQKKIARHNKLVPEKFPLPDHRFAHVHIDIVTLNESEGYSYVLTMIDRYSRWPEAVPLQDINANTVARAFVDTWVSRYAAFIVVHFAG
ncbi:unnamed protein product [Trichogramma brassicae]|uniref:RNA-directed DNA polymerase n=1 Tax=Trichogramma brassicae TaxID=86971 RepID=A0A6H5IF81_9HYME|nr:unnamed protein product [Trichogramma brassicae]